MPAPWRCCHPLVDPILFLLLLLIGYIWWSVEELNLRNKPKMALPTRISPPFLLSNHLNFRFLPYLLPTSLQSPHSHYPRRFHSTYPITAISASTPLSVRESPSAVQAPTTTSCLNPPAAATTTTSKCFAFSQYPLFLSFVLSLF